MRVKQYNASFPHKDKDFIEALVSNEKNSTTANRIEQILTRKWFEQPENYKMMTSLKGTKKDRLLDLIATRKS